MTASTGGPTTAVALIVLLLAAPVLEEIVFRAGVQEALMRRWPAPAVANVLTAIVFAAAHAVLRPVRWWPAMVLPALVLGAAYGRWRRLDVCVAGHAAMNAAGWLLLGGSAAR